jgi:hypothetical protein
MMKPLEPRTGEIYGPDTMVRFFLFKHALQGDRHVCEVPAGLSIAEALDLSIEDSGWRERYRHSFTIFLQDGSLVPEHMWDRVRLKAGTACVARPVAEGPFLAIIPALLPTLLGPLFAGMGFFGQLLLTGITIGLKFLLNKLFAPKPVKPTPSDRKEVYSILGSRNEITQWEPIPLVLGRHRITPPLCASPYTETVGDEQYLRQLFCNGYGALAIEANSIKIGETLVSAFPEAQLEHRYGYAGDAASTLYPRNVLEQPFSIDLLKNVPDAQGYPTAAVTPWVEKRTATDTVSCGLDFSWPQGLGVISDEGQRSGREAIIYIQWRKAATEIPPAAAGAWSGNLVMKVSASTQKTVRRTYNITFPAAGQYDVRVHKESPEITKYWVDANWTALDMLLFTALRSFTLGVPLRFADAPLSVTAIRIRASGQLNQVVDSYNCVVQSRVVAFNGTSWVNDVASNNPADLFRHVLTCKANRRPFPVAQIDLVQLQKWWTYCVQQKWHYNKVVRSQMSVYDLIIEICAAGRGMPVFRDGKWSVVWDEQAVPISQLFTPRNSWNFEEQRDLEPIPHGYRMRFPSETKGWREDERVVYNDGYSKTNATLLEGFEMPGVTNTDSIWKHGRFHLAQRILRPGIFSLYAGWDALPLIRGDRVRVNHDSFRYGLYSGRVTAVDAAKQEVTIDTNVTLAGATNYMFRFRLAGGTFLERTIDPGYIGVELNKLGLVGTAMPMPAVGDLFALGYASLDSEIFRVIGIEPEDNFVHRLMMVADAPEIADADTGQIPDYTEGISVPIDPYTLPPRNLKVSDGVYADGGGVYWAYLLVSWEPPAYGRVTSFQLQYREGADDDDPWSSGGSFGPNVTSGEIRRLDSGVYTVRCRCVFDSGTYSGWGYAEAKATNEYTLPPADVTNFRINITGDTAILRWDPVPGIGIIYDLRWASEAVPIPTWNASIPLVTSVTDSATIATRTGTFFIKAKKPWGVSSLNAKMISSLVGSFTQLNFIQNISEHPTFAGVKTGVSVQDVDELRLTPDPTNTYYPVTGTYNFAQRIDLGEKISSRLSIILYAYGYNPGSSMAKWVSLSQVNPLDSTDASEWGITSEFRVSLVGAPYVWGEWQTFRLSDVQAWAMEFRLTLTGKKVVDTGTDVIRSVTTPSVKLLTVQVDMQDRIEKGEDILSTTAGKTVVFPRGRFRVVPAVVVTVQDIVAGDYWIVDQKSDTSFRIRIYNVANALISKKFDWVAKGWGLVI